MKIKYVWIFVIAALGTLGFSTEGNRVSYGGSCDKSKRCNSAAWLSCQDGICNCTKPDEMVYQEDNGICVVLAGERCLYAIGDDLRYESMNCVLGAVCDTTVNICKCPSGYYESENGYCQKVGQYLEQCNSTNECHSGLICSSNSCMCDPTTSVFQEGLHNSYRRYNTYGEYRTYEGYCAGILSQPCIDDMCSADTNCVADSHGMYKCTCKDGYYEFDGKCYRHYGQPCSSKELENCGPSFRCIDSTCKCRFSSTQIYDENESKQCLSKVYGPCENSTCIMNAECVEVGRYKKCRCRNGYIDADGFCDRDYHSDCANPGPLFHYSERPGSYSMFQERCDRKVPLSCVNDVCDCEDEGKFYDKEKRKCVWSVGFPCANEDDCVENAVCLKETRRFPSKCACADEYIATSNRTCIKDLSFVNDELVSDN